MPALPIRDLTATQYAPELTHTGARHRVETTRNGKTLDSCSCNGTCDSCKEEDAPS